MFDAKRLLEQVMSQAQGANLGQMGDKLTSMAGGKGNAQLATGALAGGVIGLLLGSKSARKMVGKSAGTALKLGGLAAVAAVAYTAWQRNKAGTDAAPALQLPPADSGFLPDNQPAQGDALARGVLVAMIQGAKADGHIDAQEQARIFDTIGKLDLDAEAKAFVMDEMAAPLDISRVAAFATGTEVAVELYAATLLAMDPDTAEERAYLNRLATVLRLDPSLAQEIEATVAREM
jgi:uncharacterized membrane protein YebE (DUF533 family)